MTIIISKRCKNAKKIERSCFVNEDYLQKYISDNPESIPLYEIKEDVQLLILAREFPTHSGPIDAIGIDKDGDIYIIETKLYKNADKRIVVAQSLDYGAALWKHSNNFNEFVSIVEKSIQKTFNCSLNQKIQEHFGLSSEETSQLLDTMQSNLNDGILHFVILMDRLDYRLKDLILYVNQNSQFDIYAVEFEFYKHELNEIIIPKIFGAEVKKDVFTKSNKISWNWELFKERLGEIGEEEVEVAYQIKKWSENNNIEIYWSTNKIGSYIMCFYDKDNNGF